MEVPEILGRVRAVLGAPSDLALAKQLGLPQRTVSGWRVRGSIPFKRIEQLAQLTGRSVNWVLTGKESEASIDELKEILSSLTKWTAAHAPRDVHAPWSDIVAELYMRFPWGNETARALGLACLTYIKEATPEEHETIRRLLAGLRASKEVRDHLVGQLKLIEKLVEQEHKGGRSEAAGARTKAAG